jgi:hypothetical protein
MLTKEHNEFPGRHVFTEALVQWIGKRPSIDQRWDPVRELRASAQQALRPYKERYKRLESKWKLKLAPLCGDHYCTDWERFRPLRLSREEDWSDWLAWLLETSTTGVLAETLFGSGTNCDSSSFRSPKKTVWREVPTTNRERRADIIAKWSECFITHIEVKVGDQNFEKTFDTCPLLRTKLQGKAQWLDAILIPEESRAAWKSVAEKHRGEDVREILWTDVAHGLRKCLWRGLEPAFWQAWAWSFCCAIEARILQLRSPDPSKLNMNELATAARWVAILAMDPRDTQTNMKPEMKAFLEDGIGLYTDATDAVSMFETEMKKLFGTAIEARGNWEPMKAHSIKKLDWGGTGQRWLYTMVEGKSQFGEKVQIECGLWWNAPLTTEPVVYAGLWRGDKRVNFDWVDGTDGIHSFKFYDSRYLCLPIRGSIELVGPVNRLIDRVLKLLCDTTK